MSDEPIGSGGGSDQSGETRVPFDPWQPPAWFQSLAHEHAEHLITILQLAEGQRGWGQLSDMLIRHIVLESDRYLELLRRRATGPESGDQDTAYHIERLRQHITLTRQVLLSRRIRVELAMELLHHFVEEQALYLDQEAREKILEASEQAERMSRWTVGSLMGTQ